MEHDIPSCLHQLQEREILGVLKWIGTAVAVTAAVVIVGPALLTIASSVGCCDDN